MDTLDRILFLIKKNGLSENKFSEMAGLSKSTVYEWRSKKTKSYEKHIPKIAEVLGTTEDYLLNGELDEDTKKELLSEERAILLMKQMFIEKGILPPGEMLTDDQIDVVVNFIADNAETLRKLIDSR